MEIYKNLNRNSDIHSYQVGHQFIIVRFKDDSVYTYTGISVGFQNLEKMKMLADQGKGLTTFINNHAKKLYASKTRGSRNLDL